MTAFAPAALEKMNRYQWPGNIRELRNVIERAAALAAGPVIQFADLPESIRGPRLTVKCSPIDDVAARPAPAETPVVEDGVTEASRILALLRKHNNNRRRAATELGIPGFHPHELRHTAASLAIASGADIKIVQQMLGHKSAVMTLDQYGHLFGDRLDIVADAMDAARTSALAGGYPVGTGGEVVELRRDAK